MPYSLNRMLRPSILAASLSTLSLAAFAGCDTGDSSTDPRPSCPPSTGGMNCIGPTGGTNNTSGGNSSGMGGGGGFAATNDISGNVGVLYESGFSQVSPYIGASRIQTTDASGAPIEAQYGEMITSFTLQDVEQGAPWFFVQDQTAGATGIFSTHSIVNVPTSGSVTLPVVDRNVITAIAGSLPTPLVIDGSRGVLVLKVVRGGQPLAGVSLATPLNGATLAYDTGIGLYSNDAKQTGPAGVILALNVDGPTSPQIMDLTLTDANQQSFFVKVRVQAATATYVGFDLK